MKSRREKRKMDDLKEFKTRYKEKLKNKLENEVESKVFSPASQSKNYQDFKEENYPNRLSLYEKGCEIAEKFLNVKPDKKNEKLFQKAIDTVHLGATPTGAYSLSLLVPIATLIIGMVLSTLFPMITGTEVGMFGMVFFLIMAFVLYAVMMKIPSFIQQDWRMKASGEIVLGTFYIVTYMRHTSNLENAIGFAAEHLSGPLALDFKRVLWTVETQQFSSIKEALDDYLGGWREDHMEFVEAIHLIESSLYESSEARRVDLLDKSLEVILEETYENMLHYAQNLKSPITTLQMLGIIMPILGLVMLPLIGGFMTNESPPDQMVVYVATVYNVVIPLMVYYFGRTILATRPGGSSQEDLTKDKKMKRKQGIKVPGFDYYMNPMIFSVLIAVIFVFIGLTPMMIKPFVDTDFVIWQPPTSYSEVGEMMNFENPNYGQASFQFLGYKKSSLDSQSDKWVGPYGLGAAILSLLVPLGFAYSVGFYLKHKTQNLMKIREDTKKLEQEFASSLFQLGNRLGDGMPSEIAFVKVAEVMEGTLTGNFFNRVTVNIRKLGMSVKDAIFSPSVGAIKEYPSNMIRSSMKVLVESSRKGPKIAAQALINISRYIKELHRVDERVRDLMADVIGAMKSQVSFLTPVIAGVVIGITSMVTFILSKLKSQIDTVTTSTSGAGMAGQYDSLLKMFGDGIPTYFVQMIVGIYVVQMIYLLSMLTVKIETGPDPLAEKNAIAKNLIKSATMYAIISLIVMILFNSISSKLLGSRI